MKRIFIGLLSLLLVACNQSSDKSSTVDSAASDAQTLQTLKEAYEFGFPLMVMHATQKVMTNVDKPHTKGKIAAPINQLVSAIDFPDDKFRDVVRPNNDTYYSSACIDLQPEPLVLQLPNTGDRYALFPMLDAWTNVFFSPGKRTTGTEAQTYLITGPEWSGEVPAGMKEVKSPTSLVWLIGRVQVNSAKDGATTVKKIQDGCKLIPLSAYGKPYTPPAGKVDPSVPQKSPNNLVTDMPASDYFNLLNKLMVNNPPTVADSAILKKLAPLGIAPGASFNTSTFSAALQDSLKAIPSWAKANLPTKGLGAASPVNGWSTHKGMASYGTRYAFRAGIAYGGLGANLDEDAIYPVSMTDADGKPYDGSQHSYVMHFDPDKTPPTNAFWSLTMYNTEGFLVTNPINRFAIGDRNPLRKNADGSLDIYIQKDSPGKDKENNWLPAPSAAFNLLLRVYWPKEEMINGTWTPPGVKKQ